METSNSKSWFSHWSPNLSQPVSKQASGSRFSTSKTHWDPHLGSTSRAIWLHPHETLYIKCSSSSISLIIGCWQNLKHLAMSKGNEKGKNLETENIFSWCNSSWVGIFLFPGVSNHLYLRPLLLPSHYKSVANYSCKLHAFKTSKTPNWGQRDIKYSHILRRATNNWAKKLSSGLNWLQSTQLSHCPRHTAGLGERETTRICSHMKSVAHSESPFCPLDGEEEDGKALRSSFVGCGDTYSKDIQCSPRWLGAVAS